jgi:Xaa-Pro aminopeptidase
MMLLHEKADQAEALLRATGLDCWLTFVRETGIHPDPGVELIVGTDVTWISAFLFGPGGRRVAIVGRFDVANIRTVGVFQEIIGYDEGIRQPLLQVLREWDPQRIGLNYSTDDPTADGLTQGMWLLLNDLLRDTPYGARLTSAAPLLARLRARKSPTEIARIRAAVAVTEAIAGLVTEQIRPGVSEVQLADFVHEQFRRRGLASAWDWESCPIVNSGPDSEPGHTKPRADLRVAPGHLVHIDLGVKQDGYCSDLQRMWYVRRPGEDGPPEAVRRGFATVIGAIEAAAAVLRPGVPGYEVDAAARRVVVEAGYPEYKHGTGHGLGRAVHDGGTHLGPRWEKYGKTPEGLVEAGNIFTLELGVTTEAGYIGVEEDVLVTDRGCEFLSSFQRELMVI